MLMAAMKQDHGSARGTRGRPEPIEQLDPVMGQEFVFFDGAHDGSDFLLKE
jgi:hypothetical protein